ncbi:MAG: phosphate ABC transporter substrate-binding protein PstS [Beutenbergiaceae bacterium]
MKFAPAPATALIAAAVIALTTACGPGSVDRDGQGTSSGSADSTALSGTLAGSGASSQEAAQNGWIAGFTEANPDVRVSYDPTGSGTGREQFLNSTVLFAGSDAALDADERDAAAQRCFGGEALELPLYISPIAVIYNLPGLDTDHLNLTPEALAGIFAGTISSWDDPTIADANPDVDLPALAIVAVNRSDDSGTTENFTEYLDAVAPDVWTHGAIETWPIAGTVSGAQTSGMVDVVGSQEGAIGYADASRTEDLGTAAIGVGDEFVPYSAQAAAAIVDASPATQDATDLRLTIELQRETTASGTYPIVLISYLLACSQYDSEQDADNVAAYLGYLSSTEGQARAAEPDVAGSAPISDELRSRVEAAIEQISATS